MRQVEERGLELANALNAAAAAESECAKLMRTLEEERKLVQRLKLERDDEAQMSRTKIAEIDRQLATAQKNVEYATTRADVAVNEWMKAKRELQEERELVQLLKLDYDEARQSAMRQVEEKQLQLANALNAAAIVESECPKLKRMLEEERKLVQRLKLEKDNEAQMAKRKVEEIVQELADAQKDVEYATARADVAESECPKLKRMLEEERKLVQRLKLEKDNEAQMAKRKVEEIGRELADAQKDVEYATARADVAETECPKLKRMLEEERKLVQRLKLEKDNEAQMAKRKVEEIGQELADALKDVEYATARADVAETECPKLKRMLEEERKLVQRLKQEKDNEAQMAKRKVEEIGRDLADAQKDVEYATARADVAESECPKLKRMLEEERKLVHRLKLEKDNEAQMAKRKVEEIGRELADAQKDVEYATARADVAESECPKLKRMLEEERKLVQRLKLEKDNEAQMAKREVEEISQELAVARKDFEYATTRADVAENEWMKAKKELLEERELVQLLKPECEEARQSAMRQVEEKELELANALNAAAIAESECAKLKRILEQEQNLVQSLKLEKDDWGQMAMREVEEIGQQLADARKDLDYATSRADIAENEWSKAKKDLQEERELVRGLLSECEEIRQSATRQVEEKNLELANALNARAIAENKWIKTKRELQEMREEKELELANALNRSAAAQACAICLTNEKDMAFGCGHMTCRDCGLMMSVCPICREQITSRLRLFPG